MLFHIMSGLQRSFVADMAEFTSIERYVPQYEADNALTGLWERLC